MKQKKQNRILAALLAAAMMFQMLPMLAFADEGAGSEGAPSDVTLMSSGKSYSDLKEAVKEAEVTDTIELGEGNYTLYGTEVTAGKDLTFVGLGPDKTAWNIGAKVLNSGECDTTYKDDFSLKGSNKVTFKNMTLRSGTANYLGFKHSNDTVVENCALYGRTTYWGYNSAKFIGSTFYAPNGDYAIWTYYCKEMTFEYCTFNTSGKAVNVYSDFEADQRDYTINFNNCTVNSTSLNKQALNINDSNKGTHKNTININNSTVTAARDQTTCSQIFGFGGKSGNNAGNTDVYLNGKLVWSEGEMLTHDYTDGEKDNAYTIDPVSEWENKGDHFERKVTKTCNYCKRQFPNVTEKGYQLSYDLNGGGAAAGADYTEKIVAENKTVTLAAAPAPAQEGVYFLGWEDEKGKQYNDAATIKLTANTKLTAKWGDVPPVEPGTPAGGGKEVATVIVAAGTTVIGYYVGTELLKHCYGLLYWPRNRSELALMLWEDADRPMPESTLLYPDVGQKEEDMDLQHAARWAMENELLPDLNWDDSRTEEEMKFYPNYAVSRVRALYAWRKAQQLKQDA